MKEISDRIKPTGKAICLNYKRIDDCCRFGRVLCPDCNRTWNIMRWQAKTYLNLINDTGLEIKDIPDPRVVSYADGFDLVFVSSHFPIHPMPTIVLNFSATKF